MLKDQSLMLVCSSPNPKGSNSPPRIRPNDASHAKQLLPVIKNIISVQVQSKLIEKVLFCAKKSSRQIWKMAKL